LTEIVVEDVAPGDLDEICAPAFEDDLRKTLPLRAEKDEPFLKRFPDRGIRKRITEMLQNQDYCRTIDVYFGVEGERGIKQLWKYFPHFRIELEFPKDNVYVGVSQGGDFAYYIVHTIAEDMHSEGYDEERGWAEMRRRRGDGQIGWMGRACKGRDVGTIQAWCVGSYSP
jgi:hypothetical protein